MLPGFRYARGVSAIALLVAAGCDGSVGGAGGGGGGGTPTVVGPALDFPASNTVTCADGVLVQINPTFPQPTSFPGSPSCTYLTISAGTAANQPVLQPSGPGTITSATIRVGAVTGPMRFVRMRLLYQNGFGPACCSAEQYADVFVPNANADTTVPLNFPITFETAPPPTDTTTVVAQDYIALEVLAPNVPIPGFWRQNGGQEQFLNTEVWLPALSSQFPAPTKNLRSAGSFSGFIAAFNYTFVPR